MGAVGFFLFVLVAGNVLKDLMGYVLAGQLSVEDALELVMLLIPPGVSYALPIGLLCGVLLVLGRLSSDSEIVAMRAAGLSIRRVSVPILLLGLIGASVSLVINFVYMPEARTRYKTFLDDFRKTKVLRVITPKTFIRDFKGRVIFVDEKRGNELIGLKIWLLDDQQRVTEYISAAKGTIDEVNEGQKIAIIAYECSVLKLDGKTPEDYEVPPQTASFGRFSYELPLEKIQGGSSSLKRKPDWLTWSELRAEQKRLSEIVAQDRSLPNRQALTKIRLTLHDKASMACATFAFVFLAVPLGITVSRRESSANLGVAVGLALAYYFLNAMIKWMEKSPQLHPEILIWLPNLVFIWVGLKLLRKVEAA